MTYRIQLPQFEGPLELLSLLIEKRKLDVTLVSLAEVADQYLEYVASQKTISLDNLSRFLAVASRLVLIKSKALLPQLVFDEEEEEDMADLEYRLREYRVCRAQAQALSHALFSGNRAFAREQGSMPKGFFYPPASLTPNDVRRCYAGILSFVEVRERREEQLLGEVISLEEKIVSLQTTLKRRAQLFFSEIVASSKSRSDAILSFLAMLELVKQKLVHVEQSEGLFGEIHIKSVL